RAALRWIAGSAGHCAARLPRPAPGRVEADSPATRSGAGWQRQARGFLMSALIRCYPGDRALELLLVVILAVTLMSSAAWLLAQRLAGQAALRHAVVLAAVISSLAFPVVAWVCAAANLSLVWVPILCSQQAGAAAATTQVETFKASVCTPSPG